MLLGGVFLAFGTALTILFKGIHVSHTGELGPAEVPEDCAFVLSDNPNGGLGPTVVALLELMLGGGPEMNGCLHESTQAVSAPLVMDFYYVTVILLALNMLIAQMTTTYERMREKLAVNYQFIAALLVFEWIEMPWSARCAYSPRHS